MRIDLTTFNSRTTLTVYGQLKISRDHKNVLNKLQFYDFTTLNYNKKLVADEVYKNLINQN